LSKILVATIGKTSGFKGFLKLHLSSDFIEQFNKKRIWNTSIGELKIEQFLAHKGLIKFKNFDSLEKAKELVNVKIFSSEEESRELCELEEDEYFWFDIIGLHIVEDGEKLGTVSEIERILETDYLVVKTEDSLVSQKLPKTFLIPYIDRYIIDVKVEDREIFVVGGKDILEAS
jgi:16S rRNA processing protein RimM